MKVEQNEGGTFTITDDTGVVRGRFRDAESIAAYFAVLVMELDRLRWVEHQYHDVMGALKRSKRDHGDCKSGDRYDGQPLACSKCMAEIKLDEALKEYKGRRVGLA